MHLGHRQEKDKNSPFFPHKPVSIEALDLSCLSLHHIPMFILNGCVLHSLYFTAVINRNHITHVSVHVKNM